MEQEIFAVVGGDLRQAWLAGRLAETYRVRAALLESGVALSPKVRRADPAEAVRDADAVILPLPVTTDGEHLNAPFGKEPLPLGELFPLLKGKTVLGGRVTPEVRALAQQQGADLIDYFAREELAVLNAVPTAEGALELAMGELPTTVFGSRVLICGFGRVGRVLCRLLTAMGAKVTVAARRHSDFAWIRIFGAEPAHTENLPWLASSADLVFNTVPALLFGEEALKALPREALVIDLASKPGGVDFEAARALGVRTIWALSLPGKTAPISSGEFIREAILNILQERSETYGK